MESTACIYAREESWRCTHKGVSQPDLGGEIFSEYSTIGPSLCSSNKVLLKPRCWGTGVWVKRKNPHCSRQNYRNLNPCTITHAPCASQLRRHLLPLSTSEPHELPGLSLHLRNVTRRGMMGELVPSATPHPQQIVALCRWRTSKLDAPLWREHCLTRTRVGVKDVMLVLEALNSCFCSPCARVWDHSIV